jgi:hypothetical protein
MYSPASKNKPTFVPWDIEVARINFKANCGPSAFAAITKNQVCRVLQYFPHFRDHQSTNLTEMTNALGAAGYVTEIRKQIFPQHGLALIQFLGPWTERHFFSRWSLIHTHWIAVDGDWRFDHTTGKWMETDEWAYKIAPAFVAETSRATGWAVKFGMEVSQLNSRCLEISAGV